MMDKTFKSLCSFMNLQRATILVAVLNIIYATLILTFDYLLQMKNFNEVYWVCFEYFLDLLLCGVLAYGAIKNNCWLLLPWILYNAFRCVFWVVQILIFLYVQSANSCRDFPVASFLKSVASACAMILAWVVVVRFFHERRDAEFTVAAERLLVLHRHRPFPRNPRYPIFTLHDSKGNSSNSNPRGN